MSRNNLRYLFLLLILALGMHVSASERIALVIGNGGYSGGISPLRNPVNDAQDVAAKLKGLGWTVIFAQDATRKDFSRRLAEFYDLLRANPESTAVFYYAGHGVQLENKNYLLPIGEDYELPIDVKENAFSIDRVMEVFAEAQVSYSVVILDACRDSPFSGKSRSIGSGRGLTIVPADETALEGSAVIFATAPHSVAADGQGRNGIFTESLLKFIDQGYSLPDLFRLVRDEVKRNSMGSQTPSIVTSGLLADLKFSLSAREGTPAAQNDRPREKAVENQLRLELLRGQLQQQKKERPAYTGIALSGWVVAALGAVTTGGSLLYGLTVRQELSSVMNASDESLALKKLENAGIVFTTGLVVTGIGAITGLTASLLAPDVHKLEREIAILEASK